MGLDGSRKWFKKWHKWPALVLSLFILLFAASGIVLNHRYWFSHVDVSRNLLPAQYRYQNWNLAAVKGSMAISPDSVLLFGNIGVWLTDKDYRWFKDFNKGFPKGNDNRKVSSLCMTPAGDLYAGTLFGLYRFQKGEKAWIRIDLPVPEERVVKVMVAEGSLWVMTRSNLMKRPVDKRAGPFQRIQVPKGEDDDGGVGLFRTLWVIHSGEIYGQAGRLLVDFVALVFVFLTVTGLIYFITPWMLKRLRQKIKKRWVSVNRFSLRWHNITGSWLILLLFLTALTGMFLRPPLLISIATARVAPIPFSMLDDPNPWNDRFRDLIYDPDHKAYILATSEGIYHTEDHFHGILQKFTEQPPVSVMGITVLQKHPSGGFLVGSFSGMFLWKPDQGFTLDYLTGQRVDPARFEGRPFASIGVSGFLRKSDGQEVIFDYANGAMVSSLPADTHHNGTEVPSFAPMSAEVLENNPMSLWNVALEFHTCRIYGAAIGDFYILLIPLLGLGILFVLVTGFFSWYLGRKKKMRLRSKAIQQ